MPLTSGTKLGPYEILRPMGAGGMGEESEELLLPSENSDTQIWPTSWSRDGRFILYSHGSIGLGQDDIGSCLWLETASRVSLRKPLRQPMTDSSLPTPDGWPIPPR